VLSIRQVPCHRNLISIAHAELLLHKTINVEYHLTGMELRGAPTIALLMDNKLSVSRPLNETMRERELANHTMWYEKHTFILP
jgi:hypothetical protein